MDQGSWWEIIMAHGIPRSQSSASSGSHSSQQTYRSAAYTRSNGRLPRVPEVSQSSLSTATSEESPRPLEGLTPPLTHTSGSSSWPLKSWLSSTSASHERENGHALATLPSMGLRTQQRLRVATAQVLRQDEPGHLPGRPPSAATDMDLQKRPPSDL